MANWFYQHANKQFGPVSSQELNNLAASGRLYASDFIWQEGTIKKYQAKQMQGIFPPQATEEPPPLPNEPPPLPPIVAEPSLPQRRENNGQSMPPAIKKRIDELKQSIIQQIVNSQAVLPAIEPIPSFRREYACLQSQLAQVQCRMQQIDRTKAEYAVLENAWNQKTKELAAAKASLTQFAHPLGKAAFQGFLLGKVSDQPIFNERMVVQRRVVELQAEHDRAGTLDKTKEKAQQLVAAGKLKLEETKIDKLETRIGNDLIAAGRENSVHCDLTTQLLAEIGDRRAIIARIRKESEQAREKLVKNQQELCRSLSLTSFNSNKTFELERQKCLERIAEIENRRNALEKEFIGKLLAVESTLHHSPLAGNLRALRDAQTRLEVIPTSDPTPPLPKAVAQSSSAVPASQGSFWDVSRGVLKSDRKNLPAAMQRFKIHPIGQVIAGVFSLLLLLYICGQVYRAFNGKPSHPSGAAVNAQSVPDANSNSTEASGKKLEAFKRVVEKYKQSPDEYADTQERQRFTNELKALQDEFEKIPFDPTQNRSEARQIVELYQREIENRYQGFEYRKLDGQIGEIYQKLIL